MAEEPDQIRDDIELTRARLAHDVDRLADKTSPSRIAQRRWSGTKARMRSVSDRVMGSARDSGGGLKDKAGDAAGTVRDKASDVAGTVKDKAGDVAEQVREMPAAMNRQTQGNPIAAGLIAFGAGMLVASLLPVTELERRAGQQVCDNADDLIDPLKEPLTAAAHDLGDSAKDAASALRDTAKDAAQTTAQSAKSTTRNATAQVNDDVTSGTTH
jgi:gas vesicle protein